MLVNYLIAIVGLFFIYKFLASKDKLEGIKGDDYRNTYRGHIDEL